MTPRDHKAPRRLAERAWLAAPPLSAVFAAIAEGGYEVRAVGGAVRDALLDRPIREGDRATTAVKKKGFLGRLFGG